MTALALLGARLLEAGARRVADRLDAQLTGHALPLVIGWAPYTERPTP